MSADDLVGFVRELDRCWTEGRFDDLDRYLAPDVTFVAPDGEGRREGLAAAVASYREFMSSATLHRFAASEHRVTERGDTAVIEYAWKIAWESAGESFTAEGRDLLVLARRGDQWRVVWRTQLPEAG